MPTPLFLGIFGRVGVEIEQVYILKSAIYSMSFLTIFICVPLSFFMQPSELEDEIRELYA